MMNDGKVGEEEMPDYEKVIEGLKKVWKAFDNMEHELYADYVFDAIVLLKDQEEKIRSLEQTIEDVCCGGSR